MHLDDPLGLGLGPTLCDFHYKENESSNQLAILDISKSFELINIIFTYQ